MDTAEWATEREAVGMDHVSRREFLALGGRSLLAAASGQRLLAGPSDAPTAQTSGGAGLGEARTYRVRHRAAVDMGTLPFSLLEIWLPLPLVDAEVCPEQSVGSLEVVPKSRISRDVHKLARVANRSFGHRGLGQPRRTYSLGASYEVTVRSQMFDFAADLRYGKPLAEGNGPYKRDARYKLYTRSEKKAPTDHVSIKALARHLRRIDTANEKVDGIRILKGVEVDIISDGTLDLQDDILKECEVVIAAIHSRFNLPEKEMTQRIIRGLKNRYVNILAHPTGRLILEREPYRVNLEEVIKSALNEGVILEINAHPHRLDLNDIHARMAKEMGAKLIINTDAHAASQLDLMRYGVFIARRGWLEKEDVINTSPVDKLMSLISR